MNSSKLDKSLKYILPTKTNDLIRFGNKNDSGYVISKKVIKKSKFYDFVWYVKQLVIRREFFSYQFK